MTTAELERAIRAKALESFTPRLQRDLDRMAADLREQGADETHIRDCLQWLIEQHQAALLTGAREAAAEIAHADK